MNESFNLSDYCLQMGLTKNSEKEAFVFWHKEERIAYTYQQLAQTIQDMSQNILAITSDKQQRIVIYLPHSPEFALVFLAIIKAGHIAVPTSFLLTIKEEKFIIRDSQAKLFIYSQAQGKPKLNDKNIQLIAIENLFETPGQEVTALPTQKETPAFLIYTSGTSGKPKGVLHAHRSILGRIPMCKGWTDLSFSDRLLHAGKLNWTYTLGVGLMDTWAAGATSIMSDGENNDHWLEIMEKEKATIFVAVPGLYRKILKYSKVSNYDLSSIRHFLTAGSPLTIDLHQRWIKTTQKEIYEALGMSEISTYISSSPHTGIKPGSPGKAQEGRKITVLPEKKGEQSLPVGEIGLLAVHRSDPGLMLGYWNRPGEEKLVYRGDWFVGGDLVHIDEEGYFFFHGRANDLMNSFGYRVSPIEVEKALSKDKRILEAGVCELEKDRQISIIAAFIVLRETIVHSLGLKNDILKNLKEHLADYKMPREIYIVDSLPHNRNGKLLRKELKALVKTAR